MHPDKRERNLRPWLHRRHWLGHAPLPESAPQWFKTLLNIGWLAGLWLPAGFWGASRWGAAIVTTASVATLGVVAPAAGLLHTPLMEWIGSACGILAGLACRETIVRRGRRRGANSGVGN